MEKVNKVSEFKCHTTLSEANKIGYCRLYISASAGIKCKTKNIHVWPEAKTILGQEPNFGSEVVVSAQLVLNYRPLRLGILKLSKVRHIKVSKFSIITGL